MNDVVAERRRREEWIERCKVEIADIESELRAGNADVQGLCLALSDWNAELRILMGQSETRDDDR